MAGPPDWVRGVPLIGRRAAERWEIAAAASSDELTAQAAPYLREIARWVLGQIGTVGALLVQLLLTVIIAVIMYANGETAAAGVRAVARRLGGSRGSGPRFSPGARFEPSRWVSWSRRWFNP
jgi:predicted PurR-regulated permease PerM